MPEFPPLGLPDVTVCNVESSFTHSTVVPFATVAVDGLKWSVPSSDAPSGIFTSTIVAAYEF